MQLQQQQQAYQERQYSAVPIPQGYAAVNGEGSIAPSQYNLGRQQQQQQQQQYGQFQPQQQFQPQFQGQQPGQQQQQQFQQQFQQPWNPTGNQPQGQFQGRFQGQQQPGQQPIQGAAAPQAQPSAFVQANAVQGVQQQSPQQEQTQAQTQALAQAPPQSAAGSVLAPPAATGTAGQGETAAAHPLQQHPVAFTVPPPPPATSSFPVEEEIVADAVPAPLVPSPPPVALVQQHQSQPQQPAETAPQQDRSVTGAPTAKSDTPVSSLHASPQPGQSQLSETSAASQVVPSQETSKAPSETTSTPSATTPAATNAVVVQSPVQTLTQVQSPIIQHEVFIQEAEPVYAAPVLAQEDTTPLTNGALAASKAAQLTPIATVAANQHVPGEDEDIYNATPLHPNKNNKVSEDQTILDDPPASPVDRVAAPAMAPLVLESVVEEPAEPAAPAPATTSPKAEQPVSPTVVVVPATASLAAADITSPIARTGSAEPDVNNITPPSPVDDMDFTEYGFPSGKLSATGGLSLPYGANGVSSGASSDGVNGTGSGEEGGDAVSRQKTIRQTSAQQFEDYKRRQMLKDLEEKIPVFVPEPDEELAAQKQKQQEEPAMSATSYPGQEWNPYEEFAYVDDE